MDQQGADPIKALVEYFRTSAEDCKARGYLEAWNERLVCANELEAALLAAEPQKECKCEGTIRRLLTALQSLRALIIGECGTSTYECVDGELADAAISEAQAKLAAEGAMPQETKCDCGAKLTQCSDCVLADWQAAHPDCKECCIAPDDPRWKQLKTAKGAEASVSREMLQAVELAMDALESDATVEDRQIAWNSLREAFYERAGLVPPPSPSQEKNE